MELTSWVTMISGVLAGAFGGGWVISLIMARPNKRGKEIENEGTKIKNEGEKINNNSKEIENLQKVIKTLQDTMDDLEKHHKNYSEEIEKRLAQMQKEFINVKHLNDIKRAIIYKAYTCELVQKDEDCVVLNEFNELIASKENAKAKKEEKQ